MFARDISLVLSNKFPVFLKSMEFKYKILNFMDKNHRNHSVGPKMDANFQNSLLFSLFSGSPGLGLDGDRRRRPAFVRRGKVRFSHVIAAAWLMLVCALAPAHAEKRVALVVGNGAYRHADKLANPVNDAQRMRDALKKLGFDVVYGENLDLKALGRAIGQFADRVEAADVALVYFAGHGVTFGDTPYVVPVDAEFSSLGQVAEELVPWSG
jgi:hypothetical protein